MSKTRFMELYDEMIDLANAEGLGDPFTYGRGKEIYLAQWLGHTTADTLAGADGVDENGEEVEYKSTISKNISATYNGVSVQDTWEDQIAYLKTKKIGTCLIRLSPLVGRLKTVQWCQMPSPQSTLRWNLFSFCKRRIPYSDNYSRFEELSRRMFYAQKGILPAAWPPINRALP